MEAAIRSDGVCRDPAVAAPLVGLGWRHPHYRELIERRPALGFLEVHSENFFGQGGASLAVLERARRDYPISLHGVGLSLGAAAGLDAWHLDHLSDLVHRVQPQWVSDHACFSRGLFYGKPVHSSDLLPLACTDEALNVLCANVSRTQDRLRRPILVENATAYLDWRPDPAHPAMAEPQFLAELARRTGCGLLVDVNNIYVNALNAHSLGRIQDPLLHCQAWLEALPQGIVGEIHVAGHRHIHDEHGSIVIDDHGSRVSAAVWLLYREALMRFGRIPTLIEWDTDIPALDVLLEEAAHARAVAEQVWELTA